MANFVFDAGHATRFFIYRSDAHRRRVFLSVFRATRPSFAQCHQRRLPFALSLSLSLLLTLSLSGPCFIDFSRAPHPGRAERSLDVRHLSEKVRVSLPSPCTFFLMRWRIDSLFDDVCQADRVVFFFSLSPLFSVSRRCRFSGTATAAAAAVSIGTGDLRRRPVTDSRTSRPPWLTTPSSGSSPSGRRPAPFECKATRFFFSVRIIIYSRRASALRSSSGVSAGSEGLFALSWPPSRLFSRCLSLRAFIGAERAELRRREILAGITAREIAKGSSRENLGVARFIEASGISLVIAPTVSIDCVELLRKGQKSTRIRRRRAK